MQSVPLEQQETEREEAVLTEMYRRRRARTNLVDYSQAITIPGAPVSDDPDEWLFKPIETAVAAHHRVTLQAIERCIRTDYGRLMIFEPPGSAKSTYGSVVAPTWAMGLFPGLRVLMSSYAATPIIRHSKRARQILTSSEFTTIFETELVEGSKAADEFELTNGSGLFATGIMGAMTSVRCFPAGTMVRTPRGDVPIDRIVVGDNVCSFDFKRNCYTIKRVIGTRAIAHSGQLTEVTSQGGLSVTCTPDHRIYTEEFGYRQAQFLARGNSLVRAPEVERSLGVQGVLRQSALGSPSDIRVSALQQRIQENTGASGAQWRAVLLARVRAFASKTKQALRYVRQTITDRPTSASILQFEVLANATPHETSGQDVRYVWQHIQAALVQVSVLLSWLREQVALTTHDGQGQLALQDGYQLRAMVPSHAASDIGSGQQRLRSVRNTREDGEQRARRQQDDVANSPLRRESSEQRAEQFDHAVPDVSRSAPRQHDTVSMARSVGGGEVVVYDLQIEETQCFFANSILVHNCDFGIIDDPIAGREEADSEIIREKTKQAYEDDFLTRLKPKASVVIIQTRWHQDDLAGGLLPEDYDGRSGKILCRDGLEWEVLNIQAKCERADDPVGREVGEYLWPEWFGRQHWVQFEKNPRTWASLYQQRPSPPEGTYFKRADIKRFTNAPRHLSLYLASDFAVKKRDREKARGPDYTEHGLFGVDTVGDVWILAWYFDQKETDVTIDAALDLVKTYQPLWWFGEGGVIETAIGPQVRAAMRQRDVYVARELFPSIDDKIARVASFAGRAGAGIVHIPYTDWGERLIAQLCDFPTGRYDDGVDTCGLFGRALDFVHAANPPAPPKPKSWKDELLEMTGEGRINPATA